jgi:hypothetical protein
MQSFARQVELSAEALHLTKGPFCFHLWNLRRRRSRVLSFSPLDTFSGIDNN